MDNRFRQSPSGRLVRTTKGVDAFVPAPLPPTIDYGLYVHEVADAVAALGELEGASRRLANRSLLLIPLRRSEALTSSAIENTYSTAEDLALLDIDDGAKAHDDTREVWNYGSALEFGFDHLSEGGTLSQWLIKSIHQRLMRGVGRKGERDVKPGEYKSEQNYIGGRRNDIASGRFVPPPPLEAALCMTELEKFLGAATDKRIHPLVEAALVHYQFETIHPFADGNGRVGRILIPLHMHARNVLGATLLYVSPYIERNKDTYIDRLYEVSRDGAWDAWIRFFLEAVKETSRAATGVVDSLVALKARYAALAPTLAKTANLGRLFDLLFERQVVTVPMVRDHLSVTYRAASKLIDKACDAGVLVEAPHRPMKTFVALEIVRLARSNT
jgi:Fic family protein